MSSWASQETLPIGTQLGRKYRIDAVIGSGAMGTVYLAQHLWLETQVALKVLHPTLVERESVVARFLEEARSVACLKSENVVRVLDTGRTKEGVVFLALEHVNGHDLELELRVEEKLPIATAVRFAIDVCNALAEAHGRGIVHRDIKPENLLVEQQSNGRSRIKVGDFGVAKRLYAKRERLLTAETSPLGTPCYMAPEQIMDSRDVDGRADLYSLGIVLYEMFTGRLPFDGETASEIYAQTLHAVPRPIQEFRPEVPKELSDVVLRCLQKKREDRYPDVGELALALAEFGTPLDRARAEDVSALLGATEVSFPEVETSRDRTTTAAPLQQSVLGQMTEKRARWPRALSWAALVVGAVGFGWIARSHDAAAPSVALASPVAAPAPVAAHRLDRPVPVPPVPAPVPSPTLPPSPPPVPEPSPAPAPKSTVSVLAASTRSVKRAPTSDRHLQAFREAQAEKQVALARFDSPNAFEDRAGAATDADANEAKSDALVAEAAPSSDAAGVAPDHAGSQE